MDVNGLMWPVVVFIIITIIIIDLILLVFFSWRVTQSHCPIVSSVWSQSSYEEVFIFFFFFMSVSTSVQGLCLSSAVKTASVKLLQCSSFLQNLKIMPLYSPQEYAQYYNPHTLQMVISAHYTYIIYWDVGVCLSMQHCHHVVLLMTHNLPDSTEIYIYIYVYI